MAGSHLGTKEGHKEEQDNIHGLKKPMNKIIFMASKNPKSNGNYTIAKFHNTMYLAFGVAISFSCCQGSEIGSGMYSLQFMSLQGRNKTSPSIFSLSNS